jgi:hypothetical protein
MSSNNQLIPRTVTSADGKIYILRCSSAPLDAASDVPRGGAAPARSTTRDSSNAYVDSKSANANGWECSCGHVNNAEYCFCEKCYLKPGASVPSADSKAANANGWKCSCGNLNNAEYCFCPRCFRDRVAFVPSVDSKAAAVDSKAAAVDSKTVAVDSKAVAVDSKSTPANRWACSCGNMNDVGQDICDECFVVRPAVPSVVGSESENKNAWVCRSCTLINEDYKSSKCVVCNTDRNHVAPDAKQDTELPQVVPSAPPVSEYPPPLPFRFQADSKSLQPERIDNAVLVEVVDHYGYWTCRFCATGNQPERLVCQYCCQARRR